MPLDCRTPRNSAFSIKGISFCWLWLATQLPSAGLQRCPGNPGEGGSPSDTCQGRGSLGQLLPASVGPCPAGSQVGRLDTHSHSPDACGPHFLSWRLSNQSILHRMQLGAQANEGCAGGTVWCYRCPWYMSSLVPSPLSPRLGVGGSSEPLLFLLLSPIHPPCFSQNQAQSRCSVKIC